MSNMKELGEAFGVTTAIVFVVVFVLFILILAPWLMFWAIETIAFAAGFSLSIPLTFKTWLAAIVLLSIFKASGK